MKKEAPKKKRFDPLHIYDELLMTNYFVCYGSTREGFIEAIKYQHDLLNYNVPDNIQGRTCELVNKDGSRVIWIWIKKKNISILAHEAVHAIMMTFETCGINVDIENDEVLAYGVGMIVRLTLNRHK